MGFGTLDSKDDLQQASGGIVSADKIHTFQETVGTPFVDLLKENMSSRFATHHIVSALAIFDLQPYLILVMLPVLILPNFPLMERSQLSFAQPLRER